MKTRRPSPSFGPARRSYGSGAPRVLHHRRRRRGLLRPRDVVVLGLAGGLTLLQLVFGETLFPPRPFSSCADARAAGEAPLSKDHPRFQAKLDADGDGIGCEPYAR